MELTCAVTQRQTSTCPKRGSDTSARVSTSDDENVLDRFSSARCAALELLPQASSREGRAGAMSGNCALKASGPWARYPACDVGVTEDGVPQLCLVYVKVDRGTF